MKKILENIINCIYIVLYYIIILYCKKYGKPITTTTLFAKFLSNVGSINIIYDSIEPNF